MEALYICTNCLAAILSTRSHISHKWRKVSRSTMRNYYHAARQRGDRVIGAICVWCAVQKDYPDLPDDIKTPPPDEEAA